MHRSREETQAGLLAEGGAGTPISDRAAIGPREAEAELVDDGWTEDMGVIYDGVTPILQLCATAAEWTGEDTGIREYNVTQGKAREYLIRLRAGQNTPAPWANVLANPEFGCVVSDSSPGYTWAANAHEFRLTPWHNDPGSDSAGEAFYLRGEVTRRGWSTTVLPSRAEGDDITRNGVG